MKRNIENRLLDFCIQQHARFTAEAWDRFDALNTKEKATVARFLAGVEWYGHREELARLADSLTAEKFAELSAATGFDGGRFAGLLRTRLERHAAMTR
jgi:hypothetical protein